jgi:hypothetical protein
MEAPVYVFQLEFEQYPELEIKARSVQFGKLLNIADQLDTIKDESVTNFASVRELVTTFAESLKSWNLTDEGKPIPCNLAGFYSLDFRFAMEILRTWSSAIGGEVSDPLEGGSNNGSPSVAPMIQMETL